MMRSSMGEVGAIMVAVAYESCERIFKVARALSRKKTKGNRNADNKTDVPRRS